MTADRTRRGLIAAAIGGTAALALAEPSAAAIPASLEAAWRAYDRATIAKDIAALSALVSDDHVLVNSDGSVQDKASYLADFEVPDFVLEPYVVERPVMRYWGAAALTGGVFHLNWTQDGKRQARRLRIVHVWTRSQGRWRIAYTQLTRVPD